MDNELLTIIDLYLQKSLRESLEENEFSYKIAQAKLDGKDKVKIGDKTYDVKMSKSTAEKIVSEVEKDLQKINENFPAGYKATGKRGQMLKKLTDRYKKAKTKKEKDAAVAARQRYEKTQQASGIKSQYTESDDLAEIKALRDSLLEELKDLLEKKKRKKKRKTKRKKKSRKLSSKVDKALKAKAKKHNAPVGALKTVYRKGQGAFFSSGSRPGQNQHSWAMARVNSFLKGGKARQVDAAQWKQVQKFRKNKRK